MKALLILVAGATAILSTAATAAKWVRYDIYGRGNFSTLDVSTDPFTETSGLIGLHATVFVETEPTGADDFLYFSNGHIFYDTIDTTSIETTDASSGNSKLGFIHQINDECGHNSCEHLVINLGFAPGSFDTFPDTLPPLVSGDFTFGSSSHWWSMDADGTISSATARVVSAPGANVFQLRAVPEPGSWLMMLGGFGVVGGALRARRTAIRFA